MGQYAKPWLSIEDQIDKLVECGVEVMDRDDCAHLLRTVGYYRLTGYLYPFRESETYRDDHGRDRIRVLGQYRSGTTIPVAAALINFDRQLRLQVLDGIERIEIALRTQVGHVLGRSSAFAHLDEATFVNSFTEVAVDPQTGTFLSKHQKRVGRMRERQNESDEAFVAHFRERYDDQMPIWALTEIMELGHLVRLYRGLVNSLATEIAAALGVPSKNVMASWIASLNYVRNVSAHHARLFNRKLVTAPKRPRAGQVPLLDHLREEQTSKQIFGVYNVLAVMAYLLRSIDPERGWAWRTSELLLAFPESKHLTVHSMGVPENWEDQALWH